MWAARRYMSNDKNNCQCIFMVDGVIGHQSVHLSALKRPSLASIVTVSQTESDVTGRPSLRASISLSRRNRFTTGSFGHSLNSSSRLSLDIRNFDRYFFRKRLVFASPIRLIEYQNVLDRSCISR